MAEFVDDLGALGITKIEYRKGIKMAADPPWLPFAVTSTNMRLSCVDWPETTDGPRHNGTDSSLLDTLIWTAKMLGLAQVRGDEGMDVKDRFAASMVTLLRMNWREAGQDKVEEKRDELLRLSEPVVAQKKHLPEVAERDVLADLWCLLAEASSLTGIQLRVIDTFQGLTCEGFVRTWGALEGCKMEWDHGMLEGVEFPYVFTPALRDDYDDDAAQQDGHDGYDDWSATIQFQGHPPHLLSLTTMPPFPVPEIGSIVRVKVPAVPPLQPAYTAPYLFKCIVLRREDHYMSLLRSRDGSAEGDEIRHVLYDSMKEGGRARQFDLIEMQQYLNGLLRDFTPVYHIALLVLERL